MLKVLGEDAKPLIESGDPVADKNARDEFRRGLQGSEFARQERSRTRSRSKSARTNGPSPFPIVKERRRAGISTARPAPRNSSTAASGENELATIQSCLAFVDAQREYYMRNVQKDSVAALRQTSSSAPKARRMACTGRRPRMKNRARSAKAFAQARAEGYLQEGGTKKGAPFHGYIYRLLTEPGAERRRRRLRLPGQRQVVRRIRADRVSRRIRQLGCHDLHRESRWRGLFAGPRARHQRSSPWRSTSSIPARRGRRKNGETITVTGTARELSDAAACSQDQRRRMRSSSSSSTRICLTICWLWLTSTRASSPPSLLRAPPIVKPCS